MIFIHRFFMCWLYVAWSATYTVSL